VRLILAGSIAGCWLAGAAQGETSRPLFRHRTTVLRSFLPSMKAPKVNVQEIPPTAPTQFNPDPGNWDQPTAQAVPASARDDLFPSFLPEYGTEPLPTHLRLPRGKVLGRDPVKKTFTYREYPLGREGLGLLPNSRAVPNRWLLPFPRWTRYHDPTHEAPYLYDTPRLWHPYEQSTLKGDVPVIGQDIFLNLTAKNFTLFEYRRLPLPSGVSAAQANSSEFFGRGEQVFLSNDTSLAVDLFKGETSFKPVTWLFRANAVYNQNWIRIKENGLLDPDVRGPGFEDDRGTPNTSVIQAIKPEENDVNPRAGDPGRFRHTVNPPDLFNYIAPQLRPIGDARPLVKVDPVTQEIPEKKAPEADRKNQKNQRHDLAGTRYTTRHKDFFALQEAFLEIHVADLSANYDFISSRFGIQPFVSDFRGFIFADTNLGIRLFGNADNNRTVYNLALFDMREKDTYSDLNKFDSRHQRVLVANVFRQDLLWKGYTAQLSFHGDWDDGGTHYDQNGFLTRPQTLGTVPDEGDFRGSDGSLRAHDVRAFYLGWAGDGHIGRLNLTHAFYQVLGEDEFNGLAGRRVDINAQMAALELSYDRDWIRLKASGFYASGDSDPTDRTARGFDTVLDNPFFIGGPFSWYVHQGFNLAGTSVNLKQRDSLVPNLRTSKTEGQSNFVNPGVLIVGLGTDVEVTPKLKAFGNLNHIWLSETKALETALQTNKLRSELGLDASLGFKYRPLLTENVIISAGVGFFFPGAGYRDIFRRNTTHVPGFGPQEEEGKVDDYLYNGFLTVTLLY
jgi:hypothetical protein